MQNTISPVGTSAGALIAVTALAWGLATSACAAPKAPAGVTKTISQLSNGQATILETFDGPAGTNLTGMAVSLGQGRNMIMYATKDGKYVFVGGIFGADGTNYSMQAAQKYLPNNPGLTGSTAPAQNVEQIFKDLDKAHAYLWGKSSAKKEIWVVMDPDCVFCHKIYMDAKPLVEKGDLKVNVIQVGFLKPDSIGKAAAIVGAPDPAAALAKDEEGFDASREEGGIRPDTSNEAATAKVKANNQWMQAHGIGGTPYVIYRDKDGRPGVVPGYPQDLAALLKMVKSAD